MDTRNPNTERDSHSDSGRDLFADDVIDPDVQDVFLETQQLAPVDNSLARRHDSGSPSPITSGGDIDAQWDTSQTGEESVGGSTPTPDQDVVDELGEAVGVTYQDDEPLRTTDKLNQRDRDRWELNPASSEDYQERLKDEGRSS